MKLTKTEKKLIERAKELNNCVRVDHGVTYKKSFGNREINAARKLVKMGILVKVPSKYSETSSHGYGRMGGSIGFTTSSAFKLVG